LLEIRVKHRHSLPVLFWLSSYVASHHLAVAPQSGAKDQFYCAVYSKTLNSNCEAQSHEKNCRRWSQKPKLIMHALFTFLKGENYA
jgi:hypothetical protein